MTIVNNSETEDEARKKSKLLIKNMKVGKRWQLHIWRVRGTNGILWRYKIFSVLYPGVRIEVYPTTGGRDDAFGARFSVDIDYDDRNSEVHLPEQYWENELDPNQAVLKRIIALKKALEKRAAVTEKALARL